MCFPAGQGTKRSLANAYKRCTSLFFVEVGLSEGHPNHAQVLWVGPPPTNSGILGIYKDPSTITITSRGHY